MKLILSVSLNKKDIINLIARYHFNDADYDKLHCLYQCVLPLIDAVAYVDINQSNDCANALVTLGNSIDSFRDLYSDKSLLSEAYMIECIGFELLTSAYKDLVTQLQCTTGLFVSAIDFLGDKYPLSLQNDFITTLQPQEIALTSSGMLSPSKSVSMILTLTANKPECSDLFNTCATCPNTTCSHRFSSNSHIRNKIDFSSLPRTYGNQTIFGLNESNQ